jgi:hypothetical protein
MLGGVARFARSARGCRRPPRGATARLHETGEKIVSFRGFVFFRRFCGFSHGDPYVALGKQCAMADESTPTQPLTMPSRRQNHERIDGLKCGPYMPGHDACIAHRFSPAPPPSQHGTDARSRVNAFVPPVPRHFSPDILSVDSLPAESA